MKFSVLLSALILFSPVLPAAGQTDNRMSEFYSGGKNITERYAPLDSMARRNMQSENIKEYRDGPCLVRRFQHWNPHEKRMVWREVRDCPY